jgi:hypothetical protein
MHCGSPLLRLRPALFGPLSYERRERRGEREALGPVRPGVFPRLIRSGYYESYFICL